MEKNLSLSKVEMILEDIIIKTYSNRKTETNGIKKVENWKIE